MLFSCSTEPSIQLAGNSAVADQIDSLILLSKNSKSTELPDKYLDDALYIGLQNNNDSAIFNVYIFIAQQFRKRSNFGKSLEYLQLAQQLAQKLNSDKLKAYATHEIAVNFRRIDDQATALKYHVQALEWAENAKDTFLIHCSLNGIGNVYYSYEEWNRAIEYFHRSLNFLGTKEPNLLGEAINTNTIGEAWLEMGNVDSALFYLERSLQVNFYINSELGQAICFNGIGMVYNKKRDYKNAIKSFKSAIEIYDKIGTLWYETMCLNNLGSTYLEKGDFNNAEKTLLNSYGIASKIGSKSFALDAALKLASLYNKWHKPNKAFEFHELGISYKDSITKELRQQNSDAMNVLYESEKQKREMLMLKQNAELTELKLSRQKYISLSVVILFSVIILVSIFVYRQRQLNSKLKEVALEQKLLRAQLNPHFIFNSLSAIQNFIMRNDKNAASQYLVNFSRLMRNILMGSTTDLFTLSEEIEILDDYLSLQRLRYLEQFDYYFEVADSIDPEFCLVPSMLIQPFVENAIEHGIRDIEYQGLITIRFKTDGAHLLLEVEDNGRGLVKEHELEKKKSGHVSMATKITKQRLQNLEATHKQKCNFELLDKSKSGTNGVLVKVYLPYIEDN